MAIRPVSSVSFNNYNVGFEGKKHKTPENRHSSNPIKAIPLAALIAMSPMVNANAQVSPSEHTEFMQNGTTYVIDEYQDVAAINGSYFVDECSVLWQKNSPINKQLYYGSKERTRKRFVDGGNLIPVIIENETILNPNKLIIVDEARKELNGEINHYTGYYVAGNGVIQKNYYERKNAQSNPMECGELLLSEQNAKSYLELKISKQFYNQLKLIYGNDIDYVKEVRNTQDAESLF